MMRHYYEQQLSALSIQGEGKGDVHIQAQSWHYADQKDQHNHSGRIHYLES